MVVYPVAFSATEEFREEFIGKIPRRMRSAYIRSAIHMFSEVLDAVGKDGVVEIDKTWLKRIWVDESNIGSLDELK